MKKNSIKSFIAGIVIGSIGVTTVFAAGALKTAKFSTSKLTVDNFPIVLTNPLISAVKEGETDARLYAPIKEVFESIGYSVEWNEKENTVNLKRNFKILVADPQIDPNDGYQPITEQPHIDPNEEYKDHVLPGEDVSKNPANTINNVSAKTLLEKYPINTKEIEINIKNATATDILYDEGYTIEYKDKDKWVQIPLVTQVKAIALFLNPSKTGTTKIDLCQSQYKYKAGTYRVVKNVNIGDEQYKLYAQFNLV